eukprot:TRINITY_DN21404_c0_g1_i1.p1 TRINITY_DN21404_c0_g1~~TRINITY_DN21404_c0_g1_i1.p1  ORF type:complete len:449 (+),score=203.14 TRINITY_DN21404_c0_g1_i1:77-1348(+)
MLAAALAAAVVAANATAGGLRYDGHRVIGIHTPDAGAAQTLHDKLLTQESIVQGLGLDFITEPRRDGEATIHVRVPPESLKEVEQLLRSYGLRHSVIIEDLQPALDRMVANRSRAVGKRGDDFVYTEYHTYAEIDEWIDDMHQLYKDITRIVTVGTSYEGRPMRALVISSNNKRAKPKIFTNYGIHAREWLSPSTGLWICKTLLQGYGNDPEITELVDGVEWTFLLQTNPDGYEYTWTRDRMWRKTRAPTGGSCVGTDPNRNFGYQWASGGSSSNPCSDTYHGAAAFDQQEVKAVGDYVNNGGFRGYIDIHCCGAMWMTPWGYTTSYPPDYNEQHAQSDRSNAAIKAVNGINYKTGTISRVIYVASGSSADYTYATAGVKYSVAVEMQGSFTSPPSQIAPRGEELARGVLQLGKDVLADPGKL